MRLMSTYDIGLQLLKIVLEHQSGSKPVLSKNMHNSSKVLGKELMKDVFEKGIKNNEKNTCI